MLTTILRFGEIFALTSVAFTSVWRPKKFLCSEFFWSVFSCIWTEYEDLLRIFPYLVRMRENADQKSSKHEYFSRSVCLYVVNVNILIQLIGIVLLILFHFYFQTLTDHCDFCLTFFWLIVSLGSLSSGHCVVPRSPYYFPSVNRFQSFSFFDKAAMLGLRETLWL